MLMTTKCACKTSGALCEQSCEPCLAIVNVSCKRIADAALFHQTKTDAVHKRIPLPGLLSDHRFGRPQQRVVRVDHQQSGTGINVIQESRYEMRTLACHQQGAGLAHNPFGAHWPDFLPL